MPDISRSDSNRSDSSRPRVSFNKDVHVKRIASPRTANAFSLSADGNALVATPVRRERPRTRRDVQREARDVLRAANAVGCRVTRNNGVSSSEPDSTSSNENAPPNKFMSLDRKKLKRKDRKSNLDYLSLERTESPEDAIKTPKPKLNMDMAKRTQLSPIIESPAADYFHVKKENNIDKMKRVLIEQAPKRPPRKLTVSGVVKTPGEIAHNQNRPFSYTEPLREQGQESPTCDVIYAQVVVSGSEEPRKTTVHTRVARAPDGTMTTALYGPNPGRQPTPDIQRVSIARKYEKPTDLQDLSLRRQILLSRSESQARERFNSLNKLNQSEPRVTRRRDSGLNNVRYLGNDTAVNDKFEASLRKIPKDVELIRPVSSSPTRRLKRESTQSEDKTDNLLSRLSRLGKSKSFMEESGRGSTMDRVKGLFRKKSTDSEDDPLSSRYMEYRGSDLESDRHVTSDPDFSEPEVSTRRRLPTPSSSRNSQDSTATLTRIKNMRNKSSTPTNWFKSLDRLTKKGKQKNKISGNQSDATSKSSNLRFFGDTDQESLAEHSSSISDLRSINSLKQRYGLIRSRNRLNDSDSDRPESRLTDSTIKGSTKSKYDLDRPDYGLKQMKFRLNNASNHSNISDTSTVKNCNYDYELNGLKYGPNISRSTSSITNSSRPSPKERLRSQKSTPLITVTGPQEPLSRRVRSQGNLARRKLYDSSADSATDYDSVNSTKSTIYLHAATIGDIPGPRNLYRSEARSMSRDELSSTGRSASPLAGNKKTLSRSISVLAPWRPKIRQDATINYDSGNGSEHGRGKPPVGPAKKHISARDRKPGEITFNTIGRENRRIKDVQR